MLLNSYFAENEILFTTKFYIFRRGLSLFFIRCINSQVCGSWVERATKSKRENFEWKNNNEKDYTFPSLNPSTCMANIIHTFTCDNFSSCSNLLLRYFINKKGKTKMPSCIACIFISKAYVYACICREKEFTLEMEKRKPTKIQIVKHNFVWVKSCIRHKNNQRIYEYHTLMSLLLM